MKSTWWNQFKSVLWKNITLKRRNLRKTVYECLFPVYFMAILAVVRLTSTQDPLPQKGNFPELDLYEMVASSPLVTPRLLVTPDNAEIQAIMTDVRQSILDKTNFTDVQIEYFANRTEAELEFAKKSSSVSAGVIFNVTGNGNLVYALRFRSGTLPVTGSGELFANQEGCRNNIYNTFECKCNSYLMSGFSQLQNYIDTALIRREANTLNFTLPDIHVEMLPKPAYLRDTSYLQIISSIYFVIAYSPLVNFLTVALVSEKEKKIKEGMMMMGLRSSVFWTSWGVVYTVMVILITAVVTIIAVASSFFSNSNVFLFFLILFLYGMSIISLSFLVTPLFNKAQTAGGLTSFATMLISLLYLAVSLTRTVQEGTGSVSYSIPVYGRWLLCLLSPVAVSLGIDQALFLDFRGGMTFETAGHGEFPLVAPIVMLLLDTILYFLLAIYLDNVVPGDYGPRHKPLFCFTRNFWFPTKKKRTSSVVYTHNVSIDNLADNEVPYEHEDVEPVPASMSDRLAVRVSNLTKIFKKKKEETVKAVNGLSLDIYEGQITAILGHNGAGKTTLMNILTGMTAPTSGQATVMGLDVSNAHDVSTLREMTGVCPQHNILFEDLTCTEHLRLFAGIKGVPSDQVEKEIRTALDSVDLKDQAEVLSKNLSGGQKRKLSVAIAIIGDPKIIFLDEPTAGMDPYSRRHLWRILKEKRQGRIILLTTHFMDEADILADRKAIVNKGSLRSCGSSLFLKNRFGLGYHLNMVVEQDCETDKVGSLVSSIVPGASVNRVHGNELDITMPHSSVSTFADLFKALENDSTRSSLGIKNYGVAMTTLEEVFLKLEEDVEQIDLTEEEDHDDSLKSKILSDSNSHYSSVDMDRSNPSESVECISGRDLIKQRLISMVYLRFCQVLRNSTSVTLQLVLPVVMVILGLVFAKILPQPDSSDLVDKPAFEVSPNYYTSTKANTGQNFPYDTVPRLLVRDLANNSDSRILVSNFSSEYAVDGNYDEIYFNDTFRLLEKGVSPHYLGLELNNMSIAGQAMATSYKIMYNDSAVLSLPATINLVNTFLLRTVTGLAGTYKSDAKITVYSLDWPSSEVKKVYNSAAFVSVLIIGMAFCIIPGNFGVLVVKDREWKIRSQLRVSGLPFLQYWGSFFIIDWCKYMIPVVLSIIVVFAVGVDSLSHGGAVVSFLLTSVFYLPANILFAYFLSFIFDKWETCQGVMPTLVMMMGYLPYIPVSMVDMLSQSDTAAIIHVIFCIIDPPYVIFGALYYIQNIYMKAQFLPQGTDSIEFGDYFKFSSNVPICYIMSIVHIAVCLFLLRVLDIYKTSGNVKGACQFGSPPPSDNHVTPQDSIDIDSPHAEDEDIMEERKRVRALHYKAGAMRAVAMVEDLRKQFKKSGKKKYKNCQAVPTKETVKVAVANQTFAVEAGEVFGLLGPNGAGKTTTLNMMIADVVPDSGKVMVGGHDIQSGMSKAFLAMGYCPQHDALWEDVTLREHLVAYANIRGIPSSQVDDIANFFISNLKLKEHEKKRAAKLSGGTKRKLSYCISMLGRPLVVLLDEPSTGMDPQSKRFLWDTISNSFNNSERGAILTTHYMEEADALCSRIAIMVNGRMECIGSSQHLKNKYGSGYLLEVKVKVADDQNDLEVKMRKLHDYIHQLFPNATVMEEFSERVQYKVSKADVTSLARVFTVLEQGKNECDIVEYSFSQSTLEQVFLEFAKMQVAEGEEKEETEVERVRSIMRTMSVEADKPRLTERL